MILSGFWGYTLEYIILVFIERSHKVIALCLDRLGKVEQRNSI